MSQRRMILVGGPNGAGKTTFAMMDLARHGRIYLGADAIAAEFRQTMWRLQRSKPAGSFCCGLNNWCKPKSGSL